MKTTRLQVTLRDVTPKVTRTLDVPADTTLPELHDLLQAALGWTDSHLHQFQAGDQVWSVPDDWGSDDLDEAKASLKHLPSSFLYRYDLGDDWEHDVEVLGPGAEPGLVSGEGACPPEDCGGPPGYEHLLSVLADPQHPEHAHLKAWSAHHPFDYDHSRRASLVEHTLGEVPATVRAMLEVVGTGLKLTAAGKLPPAVVAQLLERLPSWKPPFEVSMREDSFLEVWALKELMREVGLLRLSKGVLTPTKAAGTDHGIVRALRKLHREGSFELILATNAIAVLSAAGPLESRDLLSRVLPMMGRNWQVNGEPLDEHGLRRVWHSIWRELRALDLIEDAGGLAVQAGPSALTVFPRAAALADLMKHGYPV